MEKTVNPLASETVNVPATLPAIPGFWDELAALEVAYLAELEAGEECDRIAAAMFAGTK